MAKMLRITHCTECKYKQWALMTPKPQCWHKETYGMILDFPLGIFREEIPEWCKLEDAPEEMKGEGGNDNEISRIINEKNSED